MPVRSSTTMPVAFLDSAARTARSQEGVTDSTAAFSLTSTFVRTRSCPYRSTRLANHRLWFSSRSIRFSMHPLPLPHGLVKNIELLFCHTQTHSHPRHHLPLPYGHGSVC